jgi:hypothetical protein
MPHEAVGLPKFVPLFLSDRSAIFAGDDAAEYLWGREPAEISFG